MNCKYISYKRYLQIQYLLEVFPTTFTSIDNLFSQQARSKLIKKTREYHPDKCKNTKQTNNFIALQSFIEWWDDHIKGNAIESEKIQTIKAEYYHHRNTPHDEQTDNTFTGKMNTEKRSKILKKIVQDSSLDDKDQRLFTKIRKYIQNIETLQKEDIENPLFKKYPKLLEYPVVWKPDAMVRVENFSQVRKNYLFYHDMQHASFTLEECIKWIILYAKDDMKVGSKTTYTSFMWFKNMLGAERVNTRTRRLFWDA